jgi:hypothetical protein
MVYPTCFGITLPTSGSAPSAFWEMLNWGAVDRILWMDVLCLVTWCVAVDHEDCEDMNWINPQMPELNPSAQRCLARIFTGEFASWTAHFFNICVKNQQMHQLFIQFINYVWYLLHVSALHCHLQGASPVPSERCSLEEQSIEYYGWACCV